MSRVTSVIIPMCYLAVKPGRIKSCDFSAWKTQRGYIFGTYLKNMVHFFNFEIFTTGKSKFRQLQFAKLTSLNALFDGENQHTVNLSLP